jgi:hypothetical protein
MLKNVFRSALSGAQAPATGASALVARDTVKAALLELLQSPLAHPKRFDYETLAVLLAAAGSAEYMTTRMQGARNLVESGAVLSDALGLCSVEGLMLEFGVFRGDSLRKIARTVTQEVHGFDSFEGLPEDWSHYQKRGRFSLDGKVPVFEEANVRIHPGWFDRVLPDFMAARPQPVRFLHLDCDLYSSTRTVLELLAPRIVPGTVIVLDEYLNYPGWEAHEFKAFQEFVQTSGRHYRYAAFASSQCSVSVVMD